MAGGLKRIECDPKCGFLVQSHDEKEVISIAREHAITSHKMAVTDDQLQGMLKPGSNC